MHIVGVPVKENCKRGIKKQVCKSQIFTKSSLTVIQDKMRVACIKSYDKIYDSNVKLKEKIKRKKLDNSYIMTLSGIYNDKLIMFVTARIIEYSKEEQNKVVMYIINNI